MRRVERKENYFNPFFKGENAMRADLHVHTKFSRRPSQWFLQKIGCPESFTEPLDLYRIAHNRMVDHWRRAGRRPQAADADPEQFGDPREPALVAQQAQLAGFDGQADLAHAYDLAGGTQQFGPGHPLAQRFQCGLRIRTEYLAQLFQLEVMGHVQMVPVPADTRGRSSLTRVLPVNPDAAGDVCRSGAHRQQ